MKKIISLFVLAFVVLLISPSIAFAAKPDGAGKPKPPSGSTPELVGYDISYPQCGRRLPSDHYFGIVGVNGGTAAIENPCLSEQLAWAKTAKDGSAQDKIQLYVNTANPGEVIDQITTWPTSNTAENPYEECDGTNTLACSWQYGWNRSVEAEGYFAEAAQQAGVSSILNGYTVWLDVETMNTWQASSLGAFERNVATLEAMTEFYESKGATVGIYSTAYQWGEITGNQISADSNLNGLGNWRPSGASLSNAINNCSVKSLTPGGAIVLTQYVKKNLDHNHSCL